MTKDATKPVKKKLPLILGAVALLGAGAGGGMFAAKSLTPAADAGDKKPKKAAKKEKADKGEEGEGDAAYYSFAAPFTSNLGDSGAFAQVGIAVSGADAIDAVKANETALRSAVLMTLAEGDATLLAGKVGREAMRIALRDAINAELSRKDAGVAIDAVYYTGFVIQ